MIAHFGVTSQMLSSILDKKKIYRIAKKKKKISELKKGTKMVGGWRTLVGLCYSDAPKWFAKQERCKTLMHGVSTLARSVTGALIYEHVVLFSCHKTHESQGCHCVAGVADLIKDVTQNWKQFKWSYEVPGMNKAEWMNKAPNTIAVPMLEAISKL